MRNSPTAMSQLAAPLAALSLAALLLVGCSAQTDSTPTGAPQAGSTAAETSAAPSSVIPAATEAAPETIVAVDPVPYAGFTPYVAGSVDFRSPNSNEACGIYVAQDSDDVFWGCTAQDYDYALPERGGDDDTCPENVHLTGGIESHNQDKPELSCRNDAPFAGQADPSVPVLEEGTSVTFAEITCTSRADGVTCIADSSAHGFTISRSAYSIF